MTPDPEVRIAELEAENAARREQVGLLAACVQEVQEVQEVQARLAKIATTAANRCPATGSKGQALLATLEAVFTGQPLSPDVVQFGTGEDR